MLIYQVELSNFCSLACGYCPHRKQKRPKGDMSYETFVKVLELYKRCGNQRPLTLHNFGEPTLHPHIREFIGTASDRGIECTFFTNGKKDDVTPVTTEFWRSLADVGLKSVNFSAHAMKEDEFREILGGGA